MFNILLVVFALCKCINGNVGNSKRDFASPVLKHLESSVSASSAHGTVVAVRAHENISSNEKDVKCILIVSRSPISSSRSEVEDIFEEKEIREIDVNRGPLSSLEGLQQSEMVYVLHEGVVVAMTGLMADARHLIQCCAKDLYRHEYMYGVQSRSIPFLKTMFVDGIVNRMNLAAFSAGGRPFGVQVLAIGRNRSSNFDEQLQMFTIDPSGGLSYKKKAAVIGRNAQIIHKNISKKISQRKKDSFYIDDAFRDVIQSIIEAEDDDSIEHLCKNTVETSLQFQAMVIFSTPKKKYKIEF